MMNRILLTLAIASLAVAGFAQDTMPTVTVNAKGDDVRSVIHDLFKQSNKNYVLSPGVRFVLYLSLDKVSFDDALSLICKNANLKFEVDKGVYHIANVPPKVEPKAILEEKAPVVEKKPVVKPEPAKPKGTLPTTVLAKRVTTRIQKKEIREVLAALAQQTGITIEVSPDVPEFKLDAFLINTSLKFALDEITKATKLKYRFTDSLSISVEK